MKKLYIATALTMVLSSTPVLAETVNAKVEDHYRTVVREIPSTERICETVEVPIYGNVRGQASTGDTVLGAIIGGAIGNQVGGGKGKDAATVLGAIIGADIANKQGSNRQVVTGYRIQQQCSEVIRREQQTQLKNYTIWYEWNGVRGRSYTYNQYNVGDKVPVSVSINAQ